MRNDHGGSHSNKIEFLGLNKVDSSRNLQIGDKNSEVQKDL